MITTPRILYSRVPANLPTKHNLVCLFLFLFISFPLLGLMLHVAIDGSQAYTSIQSAIEDCNNGDTVMVYPGRYFENVLFDGKEITLCSWEAISGDSNIISTTIIDGNNVGPCVSCVNEEQGVTLRGLTLENGIGHPFGARDSRYGGGVFIYHNCELSITNCIITNNRAAMGGGIFAYESSINMAGTKIYNNHASASGGGMFIWGSRQSTPEIVFDEENRCSVYENYSSDACDIMVSDLMTNLDIYLDVVSVPNPGDFYFGRHANFSDTQGYSDSYHYLSVFRHEANRDIYVSPSGDDDNSGYTPEHAMRNIAKAIHKIASDSTNIKTVHILPGNYTGEDQFNPMIPVKANINISGAGPAFTVLDFTCGYSGIENRVVSGTKCEGASISGFTITSSENDPIVPITIYSQAQDLTFSDLTIRDAVICGNGCLNVQEATNLCFKGLKIVNIIGEESAILYAQDWVSGSFTDCEFGNISSSFSDPEHTPLPLLYINVNESLDIRNCIFRDFSPVPEQESIFISSLVDDANQAILRISGSLFNNVVSDQYSGISFYNHSLAALLLMNNTFLCNHGSTVAVRLMGNQELKNNIFYNPGSIHEIIFFDSYYNPGANLHLEYNCIREGAQGIVNDSEAYVVYAGTNSSGDPAFQGMHLDNPFFAQLSATSPCVNTATPDTTGYGLLPYDLAGKHRVWDGRIDMGCFEYGSQPWVANDDPVLGPAANGLGIISYPNPFGEYADISYKLQRPSHVDIRIYNLKGQLVKTLTSENQDKGEQLLRWDGTDALGREAAAGIYLMQLRQDGKAHSAVKMLKW